MIKTIAKNSFLLSASQIIARAVGFFYFIFLARSIGVEKLGIYAFTLSFMYNFVPVADFGIERLVLRDISREEDKVNYYFNRLLPLRFILSLTTYLFSLFVGLILGLKNLQLVYLSLFGLFLFFSNFTNLIVSLLNAREKMKFSAFATIFTTLFSSILGTIFVIFKFNFSLVILAYPLSNLLVAVFFLINLKKCNLKFKFVFDKEFITKALKESWVFALLTIIAVFYLRTSVILVGIYKGDAATGYYSAAFRFLEGMILIPQSFALALFPISARLFLENKEKLGKMYKKTLLVNLFLSLFFSLPMIIFPKEIVLLVYGSNYAPAISIFPIVGIGVILFFINSIAGNIIQNSPKVKGFIPLFFLNLMFMIALCMLLIPKFGIIGGAWAVVAAEFLGVFLNNYYVFKILK